jgi:hypothetical protein
MGDPQSVSVASLAFPETMVHPRPAPTPQKKHGKCASPTWPAGNLRLEKALLLFGSFGSFRLGARLNLEVSTHGVAPKWIVYSGKAWKPPKKLGVPPFQEISIGLLTRAKNHFWFYARGMPCHAHPGLLETSVDLKGHIPRLYSSFLAWAGTFVACELGILIGLVGQDRKHFVFYHSKIGMSSSLVSPSLTILEWFLAVSGCQKEWGCQWMPRNQGAVLVFQPWKKHQPFWN